MMYANKAAIAVKVNNHVLREYKDTVLIPFGSEYSLLIKNLNTVRAVFTITIDGQDVVPGGLVLNGGQEIDLERWIKNNNLKEGNRFKFIERTGDIEEHRGVKLEDGLLRIEYQFEKVAPKPVINHYYHHHYPRHPSFPGGYWYNGYYHNPDPYLSWTGSSIGSAIGSGSNNITASVAKNSAEGTTASLNAAKTKSAAMRGGTLGSASLQASSFADMSSFEEASINYNDAGITVPGSKSEQQFQTASHFDVETEKHVMILKLLGETPNNKPVLTPVTVKTKQKCETCGTQNKATSKFCTKCGTALEIFA